MNERAEYSKFTSALGKCIKIGWSRVKSSASSLKSTHTLDKLLEEEYETLLREIDYLVSEKSCYLSFKNDKFSTRKSSEDLTKILKKHSEEVLRTYISHHDKGHKRSSSNDQKDLINYVTKIVVSRPKCNKKVCDCKPETTSKEVLTDAPVRKEIAKETQTKLSSHQSTQQSGDGGKSSRKVSMGTVEVQTDKKDHGQSNPKIGAGVTTKSTLTTEKVTQDASTGDRKVTSSKNIYPNCAGAQTSTNRLCVPENFETLLKNNEVDKFTTCSEKQDCECEAYDVKEAIKRGLVLPSSEICIQKEKTSVKQKEKSTKKGKKTMNSDGNETSDEIPSDETAKQNGKKEKAKAKKEKKEKNNDSPEKFESSNSTPRGKPKKERQGITSCFGSKKKNKGCDDNCLGIIKRQRSMQTIPITTTDKNEETYPFDQNSTKSIHTSTNSDTATQVSARPSKESQKKKMQDKDISPKEDRATERSQEYLDNKKSKAEKKRDNRDQDNRDMPREANVCNKCGRQRRDCVSGCRNTIIIPCAAGSNKDMPPGEADSLRMLIKMHSKDTSRQFDNIMTELNHQKSEIRRLNDMYQKMMGSFYDLQKSTASSRTYKTSDATQRSETARLCGCHFTNQCGTDNQNTPAGKSAGSNSYYECACSNNSNNNNNAPVRRFGPPNTAVAINVCDTRNVEIASNHQPTRERDYYERDKLRKEQLNQSKKANHVHPNVTVTTGNTAFEGKGDSGVHKTASVSTIYKNDKKCRDQNIDKRDGHENLLRGKIVTKNEEGKEENETVHFLPQLQTKTDSESDNSEPRKTPRSILGSRVLIWLKKSWINIRHKADQCRHKDKKWTQRSKAVRGVLNVCQRRAKQAAVGTWKCKQSFVRFLK